jgi:hypothetical protein
MRGTTVYVPRRNWDSPNPFLASECAPPPTIGGRGAHSPACEGVGESQFRRLEKKFSTLPTLCSGISTPLLPQTCHVFHHKIPLAVSKLPALLMDTLGALRDNPAAITDPYGELENIHLRSYSLGSAQKTAHLLDHPGLGSKKPWGFCTPSPCPHSNSCPANNNLWTPNRLGL